MMAPPDTQTSVASVFGDAIRRNVDTRMLLFDNPTHGCEMQASADALNAAGGKVREVTHSDTHGDTHGDTQCRGLLWPSCTV